MPIAFADERHAAARDARPGQRAGARRHRDDDRARSAPGRRLARGARRADRPPRPSRRGHGRDRRDDEPRCPSATSATRSTTAPIVKLVHSIIAEAVELGASDVHFAPNAGELAVQYRIDGVLVGHLGHPREDGARRRLAREDHGQPRHRRAAPAAGRPHDARDRRPHDRRARRHAAARRRRVRRAAHPRPRRRHDRARQARPARRREPRASSARWRARTARSSSTGPTGSGKTTTLYGALGVLNTGDRSIITIEDPVEYRIDGIKQMQVNSRAGRRPSRPACARWCAPIRTSSWSARSATRTPRRSRPRRR